ncbi:polymer-forming cytoskeletal protein [Aquabacterium sp. A08]|uniref:polymer-forming cytoskeletal protein n=1 Tax=Aquabacterium sp. A08 TaxID=2718532 RepID=UPI00141F9FEB|nr:polymer-forming cytoskeletal protein [Aquabacterium sp. A08]NIC40884.1 polymer-forming cytoskeletal protein [Aquabacterium sp. A08]
MNDALQSLLPNFLLFALVCGTLLLLPFVPAWREWRQPSDCTALRVSANLTSDTRYLAQQFRAQIEARLAAGAPQVHGGADTFNGPGLRPIISTQALRLRADTIIHTPLYAAADVEAAARTELRELLCVGSLTLGPHSRISGWAHADQEAVLGDACLAVRRLSSGVSINLGIRCCFERLHAPTLRFGHVPVSTAAPHDPGQATLHMLRRIPGAQRWSNDAWRIDGDCDIPAWHHFIGSLVVTGTLRVGEGALIEGSVKAHKGIHVGAGAQITKAVVCEGAIHLERNAMVGGPLVSETHVLLLNRARVGSMHAPTTVSATHILIASGVTTHGTVWARNAGVVLGSA